MDHVMKQKQQTNQTAEDVCQQIGGLMQQIVPTANSLDWIPPKPQKSSVITGTPKPDNAPANSTGHSLGSAGAAVLQKALAASNAREALALITASWSPLLNKRITSRSVPTKRIFQRGKSDPYTHLCESDVPGNIWRPGPVTAADIDIARATLTLYQRILRPAGKAPLAEAISRLLITYGYLPRSGYDKQLLLDQWQYQLADFPLWLVREVTLRWQRTQTSAPMVADIVSRCHSQLYPLHANQQRIEQLIMAWDCGRFYRYVTHGPRTWWEVLDRDGQHLPDSKADP